MQDIIRKHCLLLLSWEVILETVHISVSTRALNTQTQNSDYASVNKIKAYVIKKKYFIWSIMCIVSTYEFKS